LTSQDDPFEDPLGNTPLSPWGGRERGKFCVSAENIAKFDVQHALVIFDETHPLRFTRDEVIDYLDVACEVWEHQHEADPKRVYPFLIWQAMGKSASSLIHGHLQVLMGSGQHYSKIERLRQDVQSYRRIHGGPNFWNDYAYLHEKLGLMIRRNGTVVIASVAPLKEKEIWMMGTRMDSEYKNNVHDLLDAYVNRLGVSSFTLSIAKPPVARVNEDWTDFPVLLRLVDRGNPLSPTADMGAMELWGDSVVSSDPYDVKRVLSEHWGEAA